MPITPNTLTLALTDLTTGSATAAVTGATAGVQVNVFSMPWTPHPTAKPWALRATGTADGTGAVTLTASPGFGYHLFLATAAPAGLPAYVAAVSPTVYFPLPDADAVSTWEACADATALLIQSLNLPGLTPAKVTKQRWSRAVRSAIPAPPCVMVCMYDREEIPNVLNMVDDVYYPVVVVFADISNRESLLNVTRDALWRQAVSRAFRFQRLSGVPNVVNCLIKPLPLNAGDLVTDGNVSAGGLMFYFVSREERGVY